MSFGEECELVAFPCSKFQKIVLDNIESSIYLTRESSGLIKYGSLHGAVLSDRGAFRK